MYVISVSLLHFLRRKCQSYLQNVTSIKCRYIFLRKHMLVVYIILITSNLGFSIPEDLLVQLFAGKRALNTRWNNPFARHKDVGGGGGKLDS
jgi:hypothetical protein